MNSILNIIRYIPGVSCLERVAGYAFGRLWSLIGQEETKATKKIMPVNFGFGDPQTNLWVAGTEFKIEKPVEILDFRVARHKPGIRISRSPEQEEARISEIRVVELQEQLAEVLEPHTLSPLDYKLAWRLLIDLQCENDDQNSPTTTEQIKLFDARLREYKKL